MAVELRPSQALRLLHDFAFALVTDGEPDLSARQLADPAHHLFASRRRIRCAALPPS